MELHVAKKKNITAATATTMSTAMTAISVDYHSTKLMLITGKIYGSAPTDRQNGSSKNVKP